MYENMEVREFKTKKELLSYLEKLILTNSKTRYTFTKANDIYFLFIDYEVIAK